MTPASGEWIRVWRPSVRLIHWGLASCVAIAWATGHGPPWLHDAAGYGALALIGLRLVRGVVGPGEDRFATFVVGGRATLHYARNILERREPRFLGHNPLGGWMIVALLAVGLGASLTGWLYTTDRFWGLAWLEALHAGLANLLVVLIVLHVAGVVFTSFRQGENLVAAMIHGRKPRATPRHPAASEPPDRE